MEQALFRALRKAILFAAGLALLFQFLGAVTLLVLFFGLVFLLAAALNPVVAWLQRRGVPRSISAAAIGLLILGGTVAALWFGVPPLLGQVQQLLADVPGLLGGLRTQFQRFLTSHHGLSAHIPSTEQVLQRLSPYVSGLASSLARYTFSVVEIAVSLVLLIVLVVYSLASPQPVVAGFLSIVPEQRRGEAERVLRVIFTRLKAWALGSLVLAVIVGLMAGIGLYVLKVPFALVFGLLYAFGELLPTLGPIIAAVPPLLVAVSLDPMLALWVGLLLLAIQQLENNFIVPLVMSRAVDLHPLSVAFMMLVMGALFGVLGAILAVPAAVILKTLYQELYLPRQVTDPETLVERSERVVADEGTPATPPAGNARQRRGEAAP